MRSFMLCLAAVLGLALSGVDTVEAHPGHPGFYPMPSSIETCSTCKRKTFDSGLHCYLCDGPCNCETIGGGFTAIPPGCPTCAPVTYEGKWYPGVRMP